MALAVTIIISFVFCSLTVVFCYRYTKTAFDSIDRMLDAILSKNAELPLKTVADSRISKLTNKAEKIMQRSAMEITQIAQEKEKIQSFISDLSHQMKTPLSGITMYNDLLLEGNITASEQQEFLSRMKTETEKLQWMMDCLIKISRLEVGAIEISPVTDGIKQTISDSISSVFSAASKKNITIQTADFEDVSVLQDRKWTCEAMTNILENAVKYSQPNQEIDIAVERLPLYTKISITDYGIGIPPDEWNLIFKRFYRGKNVKNMEGAGLGLYLASLILEKQGGYILVDSKVWHHTTFSMFLQNCKK